MLSFDCIIHSANVSAILIVPEMVSLQWFCVRLHNVHARHRHWKYHVNLLIISIPYDERFVVDTASLFRLV